MPAMRTRLWLGLLIVGLPGVVLMPAWRLAGMGAGEDELLYYYPSRVQFAEFVREHQWPWLNALNGLDRPYLADPQSAVFYPPTWLFAILPPLSAYALSLWLHYSLALWGMLRLLRARQMCYLAAAFGAIAFAFCGFLLAHRAHFTMIQAACWTPWLFWRIGRYVESGGNGRLMVAALVAATQCYAGHVQIAALCALGSLVFFLAGQTPRMLTARRWLVVWIAAGGLFAAQAVPTWLYVRECTRVEYGLADFVENTWNPISLINWLCPLLLGQPVENDLTMPYWGPSHLVEQFAYPGVAVLLLAWLVLKTGWRITAARHQWSLLLVFGLLVAASILAPLLFLLPGASLFRVPARALVLVNLALAGLAALALHELAGPLTPDSVRLRAAAHALTRHPLWRSVLLLGTVAVLLAAAGTLVGPQTRSAIVAALRPWNPALLAPLLFVAATLILLGLAARDWQRPSWLGLLLLLLVADLSWVGWTLLVPSNVTSVDRWLASRPRRAWLALMQGDSERLWVVTTRTGGLPGEYIRPLDRGVSNTNLLNGYASLTHYGPLQPRAYVGALGFEPWGERKHPEPLLADTDWMAAANVGWVLLCDRALPRPDACELVWQQGELRLFRYNQTRDAAFLTDPTIVHAIHTTASSPYAFTTRIDFWPTPAENPPSYTQLVISRLALPGWRVWINEQPAKPTRYGDLYLAADIPVGGLVTVRWQYTPPGLSAGIIISAIVALLLLGMYLMSVRVRRPASAG